jgi:hypothetical protein
VKSISNPNCASTSPNHVSYSPKQKKSVSLRGLKTTATSERKKWDIKIISRRRTNRVLQMRNQSLEEKTTKNDGG